MITKKKKYEAPKYEVVKFDTDIRTWLSASKCRALVSYTLKDPTSGCEVEAGTETQTIVGDGNMYFDQKPPIWPFPNP